MSVKTTSENKTAEDYKLVLPQKIEIVSEALALALSYTDIHIFYYDIKERRLEVPQETVLRYGGKCIYEDMPHGFMKERVLEMDWSAYGEMYASIHEKKKESASCDFREQMNDRWVHVTLTVVQWDAEGNPEIAIGIAEDRTEEKLYEHQARHDGLTGLLNKATAFTLIQEKLKSRPNPLHAMMVIDLDNFKTANDVYGHSKGDEILIQLVDVLKAKFRKGDIFARFGGDEFVVFLANIPSSEVAEKKAVVILDAVRQTMKEKYPKANVTASIGIAFTLKTMDVNELFKKADQALYEAKRNGKDRYHVCR